jgi:hypothetical protein
MQKLLIRKGILVAAAVIGLLAVLWLTGAIPSGLCVLTASGYMSKKYPAAGFEYSFIEYSKAHGRYFVHFRGAGGKDIALMTTPCTVLYDPLDPPG